MYLEPGTWNLLRVEPLCEGSRMEPFKCGTSMWNLEELEPFCGTLKLLSVEPLCGTLGTSKLNWTKRKFFKLWGKNS